MGGKNSDAEIWNGGLSCEITSASNPNSILQTLLLFLATATRSSDAASSGAAVLKVNLLLSQSRGIMWGTKPLFVQVLLQVLHGADSNDFKNYSKHP